MFRTLTRSQLIADIVVAVLLWLLVSPTSLFPHVSFGLAWDRFSLWGIVVSVLFAGAIAIRRLSPTLSLAVAWVAASVQMVALLPPMYIDILILGVLYATAAYGNRATRIAGLVSVFVGSFAIVVYLVLAPIAGASPVINNVRTNEWVSTAVIIVVAAAFGFGLSYTLGVLARTREKSREAQKQQEVAEAVASAEQERVRIARDMHDVVAHSLAVVIAQADGARYAAASQPEAASEALGTIGQTARSALKDVRLLLTQLRHSQGEGPQPTLADLEELYGQVRGTGVELNVDVDPAPRGNPPGAVQLAIYRVLQEALTNAIRHGGPGPVDVALAFHPESVALRVRNRIASDEPAQPRTGGHGLIGMRERASLVGGTLEAGVDGNDFVVVATIPVPELEGAAQ